MEQKQADMRQMDWLDRISLWAIVLLVIASSALISNHIGEAKPDRTRQQRGESALRNPGLTPEMEKEVKLARNLMEAGNPGKAEALVLEMISRNPYEAELHMLMGDIHLRKQDPVRAVAEYREAVDLNPDYLDKKTPLFQGRKLKSAAAEAMEETGRRIEANPGDEGLREVKKSIYYLQRRIAGSCS